MHGPLLGLLGLHEAMAVRPDRCVVREYEFELQRPLLIAHGAGQVAARVALWEMADSRVAVTVSSSDGVVMRGMAAFD